MHTKEFMKVVSGTSLALPFEAIDRLANQLSDLRLKHGRLFILGVGGSAGNSSHATNDFRKLCGIETYAPVDNISELTARANDEGWETIFSGWLEISRINERDALLIFSVGGGDAERNISVNIIRAIDYAKSKGSKIYAVVGKQEGYTAKHADNCIVIPTIKSEWVTPVSEAFQAVVWHCLVSHPALQITSTKW